MKEKTKILTEKQKEKLRIKEEAKRAAAIVAEKQRVFLKVNSRK